MHLNFSLCYFYNEITTMRTENQKILRGFFEEKQKLYSIKKMNRRKCT